MNRLLLVFSVILCAISASGQFLKLDNPDSYELRSKYFTFFEDASGEMKFADIEKLPNDSFQAYDKAVFNFGFTTSRFWLKTTIQNESELDELFFEIGQTSTDEVHLYINGKQYISSDKEPFHERSIKDPKPIFRVPFRPGDTKTVFVMLSGADELVVPIHVGSADIIIGRSQVRETLFGLFAGIMSVMILYNLFLFISLRSSIYLYYVMNILSLFIGQSSLVGYASKYFWPASGYLADKSVIIFPLLSIVFGLIFASKFINLGRHISWAVKLLYVFMGISVIGIILSLTGKHTIASIVLNANGFMSATFVIGVFAVLTRRNVNSARHFLIAWTIFLIGVILYVLRSLNVLGYSLLTNYSMPIGAAVETVLLSFALADRINTLKKQREESQRRMLMEVKKNNDLTRNQNEMLEQKVKQRTTELEEMNNNLQTTLEDLKSTQGHLVEAEKMASLGHLTAGIAHEINNPINYVSSNVEPLRQDLADILEVLDGYKKYAESSEITELKELLEKEQELDLEYARKEMHDLLGGIEEGARRTSEIVQGLKNFSRSDEDEAQSADINHGLQSTLTILKSEMKKINLVTDFHEIPHVKCYLGKLNQVFMNVIDNAIDAIHNAYPEGGGQLTVATQDGDKDVIIKISDNGCGMPEDVKSSIFDPFYTTKDVGKGTGLGLSISYGIIEKHNGTISVESEEGKGTTFTITLPKNNE